MANEPEEEDSLKAATPSPTPPPRTLPPSNPHPSGLSGVELKEAQAQELWDEETTIAANRASISLGYRCLKSVCALCIARGLQSDHELADCVHLKMDELKEWQRHCGPPDEGYVCKRCWLPLLDDQYHEDFLRKRVNIRQCLYPWILPALGRELVNSEVFLKEVKSVKYPGVYHMYLPFGDVEAAKTWLFMRYGTKAAFVQANLLAYCVMLKEGIMFMSAE